MIFFKSTPNLSDNEKARIEFHLQQIAECIGFERLTLPVLSEKTLLSEEHETADQLKSFLGTHLRHDVGGIQIQTFPLQTEKVGGGG
jgi:hypothetical protein